MPASSFYDTESARYERTRRFFLAGRRRMIRELALRPGETVLEVGCGTGWNLPFLADGVGPSGRVIGLEPSDGMLAIARKKALPVCVELRAADILSPTEPGGPVDAVLFSYSLTAIPDPPRALERVATALAPAGRIGVVDFRLNPRAPAFLNAAFAAHGRRHTCDFALDAEAHLRARGFDVVRRDQLFGFGYRLLARRR